VTACAVTSLWSRARQRQGRHQDSRRHCPGQPTPSRSYGGGRQTVHGHGPNIRQFAMITEGKCHAGPPRRQSSVHLAFIWRGKCRGMDVKGRELGPDDAEAVLDLPSVDELAKIDRDRYSIVGIDLRVDGPMTSVATVYAIDCLEDSVLSIRLRERPTLRSWARAAARFL
jgi:hypothetical protein